MNSSLFTKKNLQSILLAIFLVFIDLGTKYIFYNNQWGKNYSFIEPAMNMWISFSFDVPYILVIPLSFIVLFGFLYFYRYKIFSNIAIILLVAGTVGNLYDRVVYDGVRDFLVMPNMFIFNIADILLSLGILIAFAHIFFAKNK